MVAFAFFFGTVVVAALLGYLVYRRYSPVHPRRSVGLAVVSAIFVIGLSALAFLYARASYPPADDPIFEGRNTIFIQREELSGAHRSDVGLAFPYRVRKGSDFEILLLISTDPPLPAGTYVSEVTGPESLRFRPETKCPAPVDSAAACKAIKEEKSQISLGWDVTPKEEAEATLQLTIPEIWPNGGNWSASLKFDGKEPLVSRNETKVVLSPDQPQFRLTESTPFEGHLVITESDRGYVQDRPSYARAGANIDLDTRAIRFPIQVVTSLGLNGTTYAWLAVVGIALSGMLGTGWLWKALELFRARREQLGASGLTSWSAKALREAIIDSFDYPALKTLLAEDMSPSRNLDELVSNTPYRYQVGELIAVAAREGWIGSFLQSALNARANKPDFVAVVRPIADQVDAKARTEPAPAAAQ